MPNPRLAFRYAKSLIELSQEQGQLEKVYADMQFLQKIIKGNRDFQNLLRSPIINPDKKGKIVEAVTAGRISTLTAAFNKLLITKGRESDLPEIITSFIKQYKDLKGIQIIKLTTATPVSDKMKNAIVDQIRKTSNLTNIEMETSVNPNIIGGFVLQTGDKMIDASVSYDLKEISRQFENNDFIYNIK